MDTNYDRVLKRFLPAVKASIAKELSAKYGMTQTEIAKKIGVTQAEVSKYIGGRYSARLKEVERSIPAESIGSIARHVVKNKDYDAQREICRICSMDHDFGCSLMTK